MSAKAVTAAAFRVVRPWRLAASLYGKRGIAGGKLGVALALRLRLGAFLHQPLGGLVRAETPCDRGHAPHKIRPADIGAGFLAVERRAVERNCVARPFAIAAGDRAGRGHMQRRKFFRRCDQPKPLKLGGDLSSGHAAPPGF